jgi:high-affinity iron transporter
MLPTFVIGLREGLEAALIVGIVAAFLRQRGRTDLLRWAFAGVAAAVVLCLAIGIALDVISNDLPQRQQEGLETVIGACAVLMVTYMVVWMRRHSRTLKAQLEGAAGHALAAGSGFALVLMAFLAVLREGLETVVFLLAAFNQSNSGALAPIGAVLGIALAVVLGWGIYRGGVRLNLAKFFRITGIVLAFVAAGLVVSALRTAHEAGWLNVGQQSTVDLSALVRPGSVQAALLTGMLGVQPRPVLIEVIGWLAYVVPVGLYVAWPAGRGLSKVAARRLVVVVGAVGAVAAIVLAVVLPGRPARDPVTRASDGTSAQVRSIGADAAVITATAPGATTSSRLLTAAREGTQDVGGVAADVYSATVPTPAASASTKMTYAELASRNGGRLPLGVRAGDGTETVAVRSAAVEVATFVIEPRTGRVLDIRWRTTTTLTALFAIGPTVIGSPAVTSSQLREASATAAVAAARADLRSLDRHALIGSLAVLAWLVAGVCAVSIAALALAGRIRPPGAPDQAEPTGSAPRAAGQANVHSSTRRTELAKS